MTLIVSDTTSSLPSEVTKELGIPIIPQFVTFGKQSFRDDTELTPITFLERLQSSPELPKTSAPPPALYHPIFEEAARNGETVIVIAPSAKMSGTVRAASVAKNDFDSADIRIIDTMTVGGALGTIVLIAHDLLNHGKTADQIEKEITDLIPRSRSYFVLDTLEYLQKGGRIGAAQALVGEVFQIKPILQIKDGEAAPFLKARTKKNAINRLIEQTCMELEGNQDPGLCVMHIDAEEQANAIRDELASKLGINSIPLYLLPPAIITHAGPKAIATGFIVGK